jgi:hypothetical protein
MTTVGRSKEIVAGYYCPKTLVAGARFKPCLAKSNVSMHGADSEKSDPIIGAGPFQALCSGYWFSLSEDAKSRIHFLRGEQNMLYCLYVSEM